MLSILLFADLAVTLVHAAEEYRGDLPGYLGRIAGVRVPRPLGFLVGSVGLVAALWWLAWRGLACGDPAALGALIAARLSDAWHSHARPELLGHRPNPGRITADLCAIEALALLLLEGPRLLADAPAALGAVAGWLAFAAVIPALGLLGRCRA
jgi:hypothetical protein